MDGAHLTQEQADEFAIGSLARELRHAVMLHIDDCTGCREMVLEAQHVAAVLALGLPRHAPSPRLKRKVFTDAGLRRPGPLAWAARLITASAGIAAVVVAIAAFTGMVSIRGQVDDVRKANQDLQAQLNTAVPTKVELAALTRRLGEAERGSADAAAAARVDRELLLALLSPDSDVADVISVNESDQAIGRFVWDETQKRAWFVAPGLNPLGAGQIYQLWVDSGGRYVSLGTFNADSSGFARLQARVPEGLQSYDSAVVTIESAPSAPQRSGPSVFVADLSRTHR